MKTYFKELVTVYTTTRVVGIKSPLVAVVHILLVILVWCSFLASLHLDIRKIYQKRCPVHGVVLTKVKGFASTENLTDEELGIRNPELYRRTWDPADIVYPAQGGEGETGSFAIVTNLVITPYQTRSTCADGPNSNCTHDLDCQEGFWSPSTNGVYTGRCIKEQGQCEIRGWCPIEDDILPMNGQRALLEDVKDFTVLLKNPAEFPGCSDGETKSISNEITKDYLKKCRHNRKSDPMCPIFRIGDIVRWSGDNFTKVAVKGGVFRIKLIWDCDLDFGKTVQDCRPTYKFMRVDEREATIFSGWNFRSADFYSEDRRTMRKQFALKILIDLEGEGRKFDFFKFVTQLGATIGLFSVASLACNFLQNILSKVEKKRRVGKLSATLQGDTVSRYEVEMPEDDMSVDMSSNETKKDVDQNPEDGKLEKDYFTNEAFRGSIGSINRVSFKSISE